MISSMTGFARQERTGAFGTLVCEIRSVNHRFLDATVRLPDSCRAIESELRAGLAKELRRGKVEPAEEVRVARIAAVVIGIVAVIGGISAKGINIAFLVGLAFAIAAAANLPSILYSLFWPRFTARGALWSIYGGLISSVVLIIFSPVFSGQRKPLGGTSSSLITDPHINFAFFPLNNPGIVAIPLAFFLGWLGTVTDRQPADSARFARMQVRALTGVGAERGGRS